MRRTGIVGLSFLLASTAAHAEKYRVDLIVFLDQTAAAGESLVPPRPPDLSNTLEPADATRLHAVGIDVLPDSQFGLMPEWQKLKNSRFEEPIIRIAWLQKDPPAEHGTGLRLRWGQPMSLTTSGGTSTIYPVDGTVTLLAERYLHVDAELAHTQRTAGGELGSFRLQEKRRVKRNELHHLDSPRVGVLVKVQKALDTPTTAPAAPAAPAARKKR